MSNNPTVPAASRGPAVVIAHGEAVVTPTIVPRVPGDDPALEQQLDVAREPLYPVLAPTRRIKPSTAALAVGDNRIDLGRRVKRYTLQNNTAASVTRELDERATPGSLIVAAGATLAEDSYVRYLHLFLTAPATLNDATAAGIVVEGGI